MKNPLDRPSIQYFTINDMIYMAEMMQDNILINPVLPVLIGQPGFGLCLNRIANKWLNKPFVATDDNKLYTVQCIVESCYFGPTVRAYFYVLQDALDYAKALQCSMSEYATTLEFGGVL